MWKTLVHNGPYVQPKYQKVEGSDAPFLLFDGKEVVVPAEVEQYLFLYCKYSAPKDDLFVENFFSTLWDLFPQVLKTKLRGWGPGRVDLSQYYEYIASQDTALTPEAKLAKKAKALELKEYHSKCILDGVEQTIGGYAVEPASIFKGLGDNPNRGKIKFAVTPEEITINTSTPASKFPKPPYGKWGAIVSDHDKLYVASFRSNVTGKIKYIYLNRNSDFKTNSEIEKYEKARNLSLIVDDIREEYHALLASTDRRERELGLVVYLIDRYAFRVGNEPSTGSGAETTGATTLTRDNVRLLKGNKVAFHFVAKDSIVYDETKRMDPDAYEVLKELLEDPHGGAPHSGAPHSGAHYGGSSNDLPDKMPEKFCILTKKAAYCKLPKNDRKGKIPIFTVNRLKKKDYDRLFGNDPKNPYGGAPRKGAQNVKVSHENPYDYVEDWKLTEDSDDEEGPGWKNVQQLHNGDIRLYHRTKGKSGCKRVTPGFSSCHVDDVGDLFSVDSKDLDVWFVRKASRVNPDDLLENDDDDFDFRSDPFIEKKLNKIIQKAREKLASSKVNPPLCSQEELNAAIPPRVMKKYCKLTGGLLGDLCTSRDSDSDSDLDEDEERLLNSLEEEYFLPHREFHKGVAKPTKNPLECPLEPWGGAPRPGALFSISASSVNKWLEAKMTGLTAKVFRTYNASILIQRELLDKNMTRFNDEKKLNEFTRVNTEIALVCNHKRAVSPEKREKIEEAIRDIDEIEEPTAKQIAKREKLLRDKMTLGVALSTSKMNYIDPRLIYTWCEKNKIPPSKIYAKAMLEATEWASEEVDFSYT